MKQRFWIRGCAYTMTPGDTERFALAFYNNETDCLEKEEQPAFVVPIGCSHADDVIATSLLCTLRCDRGHTTIDFNVAS